MKIIEQELKDIKVELLKDFTDPISNNALKDFLSNGSKFIRSTLAILYIKSQGIGITKQVNNILASGEIIHNASLLHDDVIDNANSRRGNATISKQFNSKTSILAGDFLLSIAIEKLLELKNFEVIEIFKNCTQNMSVSEIRQLFLRDSYPTAEEYLEICKGKTAILFSSILESCAIILNLNTSKAKKLGELFGICFQIKNDLEKESAILDKKNGINTAEDILGIEKTNSLLDNYKEEMFKLIQEFPENNYKKELEGLIKSL